MLIYVVLIKKCVNNLKSKSLAKEKKSLRTFIQTYFNSSSLYKTRETIFSLFHISLVKCCHKMKVLKI